MNEILEENVGRALEVIYHAESLLSNCRNGLDDMRASPGRMLSGFQSSIMAGRAVTFALQNLKSLDPTFSEWWDQKREDMQNDQILRYVAKARTQIEKQAAPAATNYILCSSLNLDDPFPGQPVPQGAVSAFIGDRTGGSGWIVRKEDGSEEKFYVIPGGEGFRGGLTIPSYLSGGGEVRDMTDVIEHYIAYLEGLINEARQKFG